MDTTGYVSSPFFLYYFEMLRSNTLASLCVRVYNFNELEDEFHLKSGCREVTR